MFCKNCGSEIDDNSIVCPVCGENNLMDEANEYDDCTPSSRQAKLDEIKERRDRKRKKEQKKKIIAVIVLVAVIIAVAGGVLAWLNSNFGENVIVEEPKTTIAPIVSTEEPTEFPEETEEPTELPSPSPSVEPSEEPTVKPTVKPTAKPTAKPTVKPTKAPQTSSAVAMGSAISNKYVMLDNIHVSQATGRYIMSFKMGGQTYYANVNWGTSKDQIAGKYYYITAHPTDAVYNGLPVYEITSMTASSQSTSKPTTSIVSGDYVLSNSSTGYVTDAQLSGLSQSQLNIAKNEIYARHGRKFKDSSLQSYFNSKSWYKVNPDYNYADDSANLTQLEKTNLLKILNYIN